MKVVILAGGYGTRLSEETSVIPKPLVTIGGRPIIWHIMKIYATQGYTDFIVCLGYKGEKIQEYFSSAQNKDPSWNVTLADTGSNVMTGGRLKRVADYIDEDIFMMTYGDGVANIDIKKLLEFHKIHKKRATLTAVKPPPRFGTLNILDNGEVTGFQEKKHHPWINGGFFVLSKDVINYIEDDSTPFEGPPVQKLIESSDLYAYKHEGFWRCMDTLSDKNSLEEIWATGSAPWKIWKD